MAHVIWRVFGFTLCSTYGIQANFKKFINCVLGFSRLEEYLVPRVHHFHVFDELFKQEEPSGTGKYKIGWFFRFICRGRWSELK